MNSQTATGSGPATVVRKDRADEALSSILEELNGETIGHGTLFHCIAQMCIKWFQ